MPQLTEAFFYSFGMLLSNSSRNCSGLSKPCAATIGISPVDIKKPLRNQGIVII